MEAVPNTFPHLFVGYSILFGCLVAYVLFLLKKASSLERRVNELERRN